MSRWKAAAIHLSISALIGGIVGALLLFVWYPPPYSHAAGADKLLLLLIGVDLALGPLLTFILFKSGKKGLRFDLSVIAGLQLAALVYGLSVVLVTRPVFLVAAVDRFALVTAGEITAQDLAEGRQPEFRTLSWTGARLVGAEMPTDADAHNRLVFEAAAGKDIQNLPRTYVDYPNIAPAFLAHAKSIPQLERAYPQAARAAQTWMAEHNVDTDAVVWAPVVARDDELIMLMDRENGAPLKALAIGHD